MSASGLLWSVLAAAVRAPVPTAARVSFITSIAALALVGCSRPAASANSSECPTSARGEGSATESCIAGGPFTMGHEKLPAPKAPPGISFVAMPQNDWAPTRRVTLSPFFIDQFEVTWGRYRKCVEAGICPLGNIAAYASTRAALADESLQNLPAAEITYANAALFCAWEGKRLPTEAEWERAARGPEGSNYPWGDAPPPQSLLDARNNYPADVSDPSLYPPAVGTLPDVSVEGIHDLFGSVDEWVADYYDPEAYAERPTMDPIGPSSPVFKRFPHEYGGGAMVSANGGRVVRGHRWSARGGAGWDVKTLGAPSWFRNQRFPKMTAGFRCARGVNEANTPKDAMPVYTDLTWKPVGEGAVR